MKATHTEAASNESGIKSWEERRPEPTGVAATMRRIAVRGFTVIIAASVGTFVLAAFIPIGGGPFAILGPIANFLLGLLVLAGVSYRGHSAATCRWVFYSFTAPALWLVLWAAFHFIAGHR